MANIEPKNQQPMSDDQELAKVLAGVSTQPEESVTTDDNPANDPIVTTHIDTPEPTGLEEEPIAPIASTIPADELAASPAVEAEAPVEPAAPEVPDFAVPETPAPETSSLDGIKKDAIFELRPLVDKLDLPAEEKFDTYLLLLRSTDDKELIAPAHEAAKNIPDEAKKAQALLDIIKEIDFLSGQQAA